MTKHNQFYLVDVWRGRVDFPGLKAKALELADRWKSKPLRVLVEDAGNGTALVQELRTKISGMILVRSDKDKRARMSQATIKMEAGQVFLPERASWLADLEAELFAFPYARHDDQCDSISQALNNFKPPMIISAKALENIRLMRRYPRPIPVFF